MVRSHSRARCKRGEWSLLATAVFEAQRFLRAYEEFVLGGYDMKQDNHFKIEGRGSWCHGTVRFEVPRRPFLFQEMGPQAFDAARENFLKRLTGTLKILQRQGATPLGGTPTAAAFRYWLRRCLVYAAEQLGSRHRYRRTGRGGVARIGTSVDAFVIDLQEVIVPWSVVRDFAQPILDSARQSIWERQDQPPVARMRE